MEIKGKIEISPNVIKQIILEELKNIDGVIGIKKNTKTDFFKKAETRDLDVEMTDKECVIYLSIIVEYGKNIIEVASGVQDKISKKVYEITSINVNEVNINISAIEKKNLPEKESEV